jgi:hypothetical protein
MRQHYATKVSVAGQKTDETLDAETKSGRGRR